MNRAGLSWTEATSLRMWEIRAIHNYLDEIESDKQLRDRLK